MKNLKLFVAPLLGAALFVTACGSKPIDVNEFKTKVGDKFKLDDIRTKYIGKKLHITGGKIEITEEINGTYLQTTLPGGKYYIFTFKNASYFTNDFDILDTNLINYFEGRKSATAGVTVTNNYFISGDTYTVESITEVQSKGFKTTEKYVYNSDLVITSSELNGSGGGQSINTHLDYRYE